MSGKRAVGKAGNFIPPLDVVLAGLGITKEDLLADKVKVSSNFLQFLLSKLASLSDFDSTWYATTYPDVEGARLAGEVPSLLDHFVQTGYLEGRLPHEPAFDASWYYEHYRDIGGAFNPSDTQALKNHFISRGYYEGRVGTPELVNEINQWLEASSPQR
jgi:hypothetical protein